MTSGISLYNVVKKGKKAETTAWGFSLYCCQMHIPGLLEPWMSKNIKKRLRVALDNIVLGQRLDLITLGVIL